MSWLVFLSLVGSPAWAKKNKTPAAPPEKPQMMLVEPPAVERTSGSLWNEVTARRLMGLDNNARQVGDLITVEIAEQTRSDLGATTDTEKDSSNDFGVGSLLGLETSILNSQPNMGGKLAIETSAGNSYAGKGSTTRDAAVEATLTCEVIEVLPSGNLRIWGWKQVRVNRETQYVVLEGIARPRDVQMDNMISSHLLAQAKIEITGSGVVSDKQGPGIGTRLLDRLWPF